ncbi:cytosine permease [Schaalia vaccimaxillae]|uniref:cytosine permease n=1 Tax=Schaalia vaccimaxillae TaxID=183916 RepID=UPI0003B479DB|nr:cytosine permease [Schaalia vaccimaxillae]
MTVSQIDHRSSSPTSDVSTDTTTEVVHDADYSFEPVPTNARRGFWSVGFVMLGFTFFSASMSVGAKLGNGLDLSGFISATVIGGFFLALYTGGLAYLGATTGMGVDLLSHKAFGRFGSILPSALVALTQMGWFGVGVAMFALPVSELMGISPWWIIIIAGSLMTASAYFGIKAIEIVSFISVPLIALLGTYSMITATSEAGGLNAVFGDASMPVVTGVGMVIGSFISGGTATPNFTRFARSAKIAVLTTVVAFFLGNTLMFSFGAVGGAFTGKDDIFYAMIAQGLAIPAIIVLGANIWTTNNNALYTTGLGLSNITKAHTRPMTLLSGILGTLAALWLYTNFVGWLNFLNAALPPIGAVLIADYFMRHRRYSSTDEDAQPVHWHAVIAVIVGGLVGWYSTWGISAVNAIVVAVAIHAVGVVLTRKVR